MSGEGSKEPLSSTDPTDSVLLRENQNNIPTVSEVFYELILLFRNNNNVKKYRDIYPRLFRKVDKNLSNDQGEKVLTYISEREVYTVPALRRIKGVETSTAYGIHKDLEELNIVKDTGYNAVKPNPNKAGRPPNFYALSHLEVSGYEDPLIKRAQVEYEESELLYDNVLQRNYSEKIVINNIITEISEEYRFRGQIGKSRPSPLEVSTLLRSKYDLPGPQIAQLSQTISHDLYKEGPT